MPTAKGNTLTLTFELERETKNTYRFAEVVEEDGTPVVGTLYVQKGALNGQHDTLTVTIVSK